MDEQEFKSFKEKLTNYLNLIISENIDLRQYAINNNIQILSKTGNMDKGWKGLVVEHLLNLPKNNKKGADYGFLEVKTVPIIMKSGEIKVKETTCLSIIDTKSLLSKLFEDSDLYQKIKKTLFVFIDVSNDMSPKIVDFLFFSLKENDLLFNGFKKDYSNLVAHVYDNLSEGVNLDYHFNGSLGEYIQPRPKTGKNKEYVWAFYMKTKTWEKIFKK